MAKITYARYKSQIRAIIAEYGRQGILIGESPLRFIQAKGISPEKGGVIMARNPGLKFRDGATLDVLEEVLIVKGEPNLLRYTYHYERPGGYFFRYEREETTDPIRKPAYHMHVILDLPHFVAPPVNLEIILKMIAVNFYSPDVYSKQIIAQEVRLTV